MRLEGGMLRDHVCAKVIQQLESRHPHLWARLKQEASSGNKTFSLEHLSTKLTFRLAPENTQCKYTCSLLETQPWYLTSKCGNGRGPCSIDSGSTAPTMRMRDCGPPPPPPPRLKLPVDIQQMISSLSKAYEHNGTPSEYLSCLPLLTQPFLPDDYSSRSHHILRLPDVVLLFLIDDDDMKVDEQFRFEHLMGIPEGRNFYTQLSKMLELYRSQGATVEFNGHQLHTHSGHHLSASDIVACMKSCYVLTKMMAMPFGCMWVPTDYPLFARRSQKDILTPKPVEGEKREDVSPTMVELDTSSVVKFYQDHMKGHLQWVTKGRLHGVSEETILHLEAKFMEDVASENPDFSKASDTGLLGGVCPQPCMEESDTRSETSGEPCSEDSPSLCKGGKPRGGREDDHGAAVAASSSEEENEEEESDTQDVPPQIIALSKLVDLQQTPQAEEVHEESMNQILCRIPHIARGCSSQGFWYPNHLTFRCPFPFQDSGFILWRAYVYFGRCVAACPVNISDPIGDIESEEAQASELRTAISAKVEELEVIWKKQALMSDKELPEVWRYAVDLWIKGKEVWTDRLRPIAKCSSLLFTWEELRQWGLFKHSCTGCPYPIIRVPETTSSSGNDDFMRLFAGTRPIPQHI